MMRSFLPINSSVGYILKWLEVRTAARVSSLPILKVTLVVFWNYQNRYLTYTLLGQII